MTIRNRWTYEEAQRFFKETSKDDDWSWEKDTTIKDIYENPLIFLLLIGRNSSILLLFLAQTLLISYLL